VARLDTMKNPISRVTFTIEYAAGPSGLNADAVNRALEYIKFAAGREASGVFHEIPCTGSAYDNTAPTRYKWSAEHEIEAP
jgi:hypothetical protein